MLEKRKNSKIAIIYLIFISILVILGITTYALPADIPNKTKFHTGSPYYVGGDSSGLYTTTQTGAFFNKDVEKFVVNTRGRGELNTKKIHHNGSPRAVYCLDYSTEFPGSSDEFYTYIGDLSGSNFHIPKWDAAAKKLTNITIDENKRGQLRWLFDQFYIRENQSDEIKKAVKENLFQNFAKYLLVKEGNQNPTLQQIHKKVDDAQMKMLLNDPLIEFAQQWAIWNVVSNAEFISFEVNHTGGGVAQNIDRNKSLAVNLSKYLHEEAKKRNSTYNNEEVTPVLDKDNIVEKSINDGSKAIMGYNITVSKKDNEKNKSIITTVELLDMNKQIIPRNDYEIGVYKNGQTPDFNNVLPKSKTLWDVVNEERFFIKFPANSKYLSNTQWITLKVNYRNIVTYPYVYIADANANKQNQNEVMQSVVMLDRAPQSKELVQDVKLTHGYDVVLRKSIVAINNKTDFNSRVPVVDTTNLKLSKTDQDNLPENESTALYKHRKDPLKVRRGDIIKYEFNLYNEDNLEKKINSITDMLPSHLKLVKDSQINKKYNWKETDNNGRVIVADLTTNNIVLAPATLDGTKVRINGHEKVYVELYVTDTAPDKKILTNIAEITSDNPANKDRDSQTNNMALGPNKYTDEYLEKYTGRNNKKDLTDSNNYYKGQQDDDDFESVLVEVPTLDLALKKFVEMVQQPSGKIDEYKDNLTRDPNLMKPGINTSKLVNGTSTEAEYPKAREEYPLVESKSVVTYIIRIYNEGDYDGYANKVKDNIPSGLEFLPEHSVNKTYRWKLNDKNEVETDYLSYEFNKTENLLKKFNKETGAMHYKDLKIVFKVKEGVTEESDLHNIAEIKEHKDENGKDIKDRDSTPNNNKFKEDDIDDERLRIVKPKIFDLALLKIVSKYEIINKKTGETGHTWENARWEKEPIVKLDFGPEELQNIDLVYTYRIQVINEGEVDGKALEVKDYVPDGLIFIPKDNPQWKLNPDGTIVTDQLKDVLLKPGQSAEVQVKLVWDKVKQKTGNLVNVAEISKDYNEYGLKDRDSTPDNKNRTEDDMDDAVVSISVRTGREQTYVTVTLISAGIIIPSILFIKKKIL